MTNFSRKGIIFSLLILISGLLSVVRAQYDSVLNILDTRYPQEKLYLHFDRPYYNPGETIWFKSYIFAANLPSLISKTVYADLVDEKDMELIFNVTAVNQNNKETVRGTVRFVRYE